MEDETVMQERMNKLKELGFESAQQDVECDFHFGHHRLRAVEFLLLRIDAPLIDEPGNNDTEKLGWACECVGLAGDGQGAALVEGGEGTASEDLFFDQLLALATLSNITVIGPSPSNSTNLASDSELLNSVCKHASSGAKTEGGIFSCQITLGKQVDVEKAKAMNVSSHSSHHTNLLALKQVQRQAHEERVKREELHKLLQADQAASAKRAHIRPILPERQASCSKHEAEELPRALGAHIDNISSLSEEMNTLFDCTLKPLLQKLHKPLVRPEVGEAGRRLKDAAIYSRQLLDSLHQIRDVTGELTANPSINKGPASRGTLSTDAAAPASPGQGTITDEEEDAIIAALKRSAAISRRSASLIQP